MSRRSASTIRRVLDLPSAIARLRESARITIARSPFFRTLTQVPVARDNFFVDTRYRNLKPIGGGSYGVVCAADDVVRERARVRALARAPSL